MFIGVIYCFNASLIDIVQFASHCVRFESMGACFSGVALLALAGRRSLHRTRSFGRLARASRTS